MTSGIYAYILKIINTFKKVEMKILPCTPTHTHTKFLLLDHIL